MSEGLLENAQPSAFTLPETQGHVLAVAYDGVIRKNDYIEVTDAPMHDLVRRYGKYSLLVHYRRGFRGWEPDAAAINFLTISQTGLYVERLAYINPPESKVVQLRLLSKIWPFKVKFFEESELEEAKSWIAQ